MQSLNCKLQASELYWEGFYKFCTEGDIAYPEGNATISVKKSKKKFRETRDNFDVRDTFSEPRVSPGLGLVAENGEKSFTFHFSWEKFR